MPAEWEPHEATWIAWPHNAGDWPGRFAPIPWVYGEIVRKLSRVEKVRILVQDADLERRARAVLEKTGARMDALEFFPCPTNRVWTRDYGPIFLKNRAGETGMACWRFNAWAKYGDWQADAAAQRFIARRLKYPAWRPPMVLEGGSIDSNGAGLLLTTEECLLSPVQARNPGMTRAEIETALREFLGVERIVWLKNGIAGDDTHGHVDDIARFVAPDTVALASEPDRADANYHALRENAAILRAGRPARDPAAHAGPAGVRQPPAARQLRQLLPRQPPRAGPHLQRPPRPRSPSRARPCAPRPGSDRHQLHRPDLGFGRAALHDATAAGVTGGRVFTFGPRCFCGKLGEAREPIPASVRHSQRYHLVAMAAIDSEVAVQREHFGSRVDFRKPDHAGVRERHRPITVSPQECSQVRLLFLNGKADPNDSPVQQSEHRVRIASFPFQ